MLSTTETIVHVFKSVERLVLRDELDVIHHSGSTPLTTAMLTTTYFPNLRFLTLEAWRDSSFSVYEPRAPLPEPLQVPSLRKITILRGQQSDRRFLEFLQLFKDTVRSITLNSMLDYSYEPIARILEQFKLDRLTVYKGPFKWSDAVMPYYNSEDEATVDEDGYRSNLRRVMGSLAKIVDWDPPQPS
jgi:hypothetical protein